MANYQELANLVWNVANDVLRGLFKEHEYGDITMPFLVLRRLDCILEEGGRKEKAINTYNEFKDRVSEEMLPQIILRAINTSFLQYLPVRSIPTDRRPDQHTPQF